MDDADLIAQIERPKRKSGRSQKNKGKAGERYFANLLSDITGKSFIRIPNSGAFIGKQNRERIRKISQGQLTAALGDIQNPDSLKYQFIWESKFYKDFPFHKMMTEKLPAQMTEWLDEVLYDTETSLQTLDKRPKVPFLCIKINRRGSFIVGNYGAFSIYHSTRPKIAWPQNMVNFKHEVSKKLRENHFIEDFFMTDFETFIRLNHEQLFTEQYSNGQ